MQAKAWLTEAHKRKSKKEENEQQKEVLALIDEEDVNEVYMRRNPDPPSTPTKPLAYNNSGRLRPQPSSSLLYPLYPTGEL